MRTSLTKPSGNQPMTAASLLAAEPEATLKCTLDRAQYEDFHSPTMAYISPKAVALSAPAAVATCTG